MRKTLIVLAFVLAGFGGVVASAFGTDYWQHVTTTTTSSVQTLCVVNPSGILPGDVVLGYNAGRNGAGVCTGNNIGNGNDRSAHFARVSRTVSVVHVVTTCDTNPEGASAGPFTDPACTQTGGTTTGDGGGDGGPPPVAAVARAPQINDSFLCYSVGGTPFEAEGQPQAEQLYASGYWLPVALAGVVVGGENVGGRHLVCQAPKVGLTYGPFVDTGQFYIDHNGDVLGFHAADSTGFEGVYLIV